jgi:hypothetical protein
MPSIAHLRELQIKFLVFFSLIFLLGGIIYFIFEWMYGGEAWFLLLKTFWKESGWMLIAIPAGFIGIGLRLWKSSKYISGDRS